MLKREDKIYTQVVKNCFGKELFHILGNFKRLKHYYNLLRYLENILKMIFRMVKSHINEIKNFYGYALNIN